MLQEAIEAWILMRQQASFPSAQWATDGPRKEISWGQRVLAATRACAKLPEQQVQVQKMQQAAIAPWWQTMA